MPRIEYEPPGDVSEAFLNSNAFVRGIMGPIGSGKSTACVMEIIHRAGEQRPSPSGKRKSRWAVIRNTQPELKTTTIKTWHQWIPKEMGHWVGQGPPTHHITYGDLDLEVMFLGLDSPDDIKKLLSLELTGAWVNEAREVPKAVIDTLTGRVGRYPSRTDGGASWYGIIMDTNPPDTDHWWYRLAEEERPDDWEFFKQPGGLADGAENLENLPPQYYPKLMAGKHEAWVKIYVHGEYGFVMDGRPVYPEYVDSLHCRPFELVKGLPLAVGLDFGLTPAAIIGQRGLTGQIRWRHEIVSERMGAEALGQELKRWFGGKLAGFEIEKITGDPAGNAAAQTDETTPFQILNGLGVPALAAETNDFELRRESVAKPMSRLIDGEPGLIIHPECAVTRKGMMGGYKYRRVQLAGEERYQDKPDKNRYSHVCEAGQYHNVGLGEGVQLIHTMSRLPVIRRRQYRAVA